MSAKALHHTGQPNSFLAQGASGAAGQCTPGVRAVAFVPGNLIRGYGGTPSTRVFPTLVANKLATMGDPPCVAVPAGPNTAPAVRQLTPLECDELLDELLNEQTEEDEQQDYEMIYYERNQPVSETTGQD